MLFSAAFLPTATLTNPFRELQAVRSIDITPNANIRCLARVS
jgi:hypothetical protein